jgi:serine protease
MIFVGAAGNSATSQPSYPAASPNVLAVSSVDAGGRLATYSNFGSWIDIAAPGGDASRDGNNDGRADVVWSTSAVDGGSGFEASYIGLQGTSMAAPHVAGVMALLKQQNSQTDYQGIRGLLEAGELTDFSGIRSDQLGFGILDASKALQASVDVTVLSPSPSQLFLGSETSLEQTVSLNKIGEGPVTIDSISEAPSWFSVTRNDLSDGTIALDFALEESVLEENVSYRETIRVAYTGDGVARSLDIPVVAQVLSDEFARAAGDHFVLLVNTTPNNEGFFEAESQVAVAVDNGSYNFRFKPDDGVEPKELDEVAPGSYYLVAGSDIDGDGVICQPGEACAEYPVSGLREVITIEAGQDLNEVSMTTSFTRPTISASSSEILPRPGFSGYRLLDSSDSAANSGGKLSQ